MHMTGGIGSRAIPTFDLLDQIVTILGTTKLSFIPFIGVSNSANGTDMIPYGNGSVAALYHIRTDAAIIQPLQATPHQHPGGVNSFLNVTTAKVVPSADNVGHSFGDASVDAPFSVGMWILMGVALGNQRALVAKYDATGTLREYIFSFDVSGFLLFELYDESVDASEAGTGTGTAITPFIWQFCVATYDGGETDPRVHLYINGVDTLASGLTTETGAYVAMEDTATILTIGCAGTPAVATVPFAGRFALPFITGKELSAAEVTTLYGLGRRLLGLVS